MFASLATPALVGIGKQPDQNNRNEIHRASMSPILNKDGAGSCFGQIESINDSPYIIYSLEMIFIYVIICSTPMPS